MSGSRLLPDEGREKPADGADVELPSQPIEVVDRRIDVAVAAGVGAVGAAAIVFSGDIREGTLPDPLGAAGLPRMLGAFLLVVGVLLIGRRLVGWRRSSSHLVYADGGSGDEPGYPSSAVRAFGMWLAGLGWALLLPRIGYLVSTWLLILTGVVAMKVRSPWKLVAVPLLFTLATWLLFSRVFGLRFPAGPVDLFFEGLVPRLF